MTDLEGERPTSPMSPSSRFSTSTGTGTFSVESTQSEKRGCCSCCRRKKKRAERPTSPPSPGSPGSRASTLSPESPGSPKSPKSPKSRLTRSFSWKSKKEGEQEEEVAPWDGPDLPIPDIETLTLAMISPTKRNIDGDFQGEETMSPQSLTSPSGRSNRVGFVNESEAVDVSWPGTPTTVVAHAKGQVPAQVSPVVVGSSINCIWHDPAYSFSNRMTRGATRAMARGGQPGAAKKAKDLQQQLRDLVVDLPPENVDEELRPHMVKFYQDTVFQADPNYPNWHPDSKRTHAEQEKLRKAIHKKRNRNALKPLIQPKHPDPEAGTWTDAMRMAEEQRLAAEPTTPEMLSPTSDAAGLMAASRFNLETPKTADHVLGLAHPSEFGPLDDAARLEAYGGAQQQSLYGWTTQAGPKYIPPNDPRGASKGEEQGRKTFRMGSPQTRDGEGDQSDSASPSKETAQPSSPSK